MRLLCYQVSLGNYSDTYRSPYQAQYAYNLPPSNTGNRETLSISDYVIIALILLSIITCCGLTIHRVFRKVSTNRFDVIPDFQRFLNGTYSHNCTIVLRK